MFSVELLVTEGSQMDISTGWKHQTWRENLQKKQSGLTQVGKNEMKKNRKKTEENISPTIGFEPFPGVHEAAHECVAKQHVTHWL